MTPHTRLRGFTLLEVMAATVVLSIIVVVVFPVVAIMISAHAQSVSDRAGIERAAFASDRVVRLIREISIDVAGDAELTTILSDELILADGSGVRLDGTDLVLLDTSGTAHVLCEDVSAFGLTYLGADGQTATVVPGEIWRVGVAITADSVELRTAGFIRERIGGA
ncbi:MAG: hypothetical protein DHS20C14_10470 [Phycisphaeraceae bacterium]|nr:MAG: hypothetical protein DHS20C14_10470 [Phycisphaeraceae bacterium]